MKNLHLAIRYVYYLLKAKNEHSVHSPFIFELVTTVIYNYSPYYSYLEIEKIRTQMLTNINKIEVDDLGANAKKYKKQIKQIAKKSLKQPKYAQLLFRLVNHFQPSSILELGTSLGITTSYLAKASQKANVITIEGASETAKVANQNFKELEIKNIKSIIGNFDDVLDSEIKNLKNLDFVFFDGNHRKEATLNYFKSCLQKKHSESIFVFDDIYWSSEMTEAWKEIKQNSEVTITIDLFHIGIVFFRKEQAKQHFMIRF